MPVVIDRRVFLTSGVAALAGIGLAGCASTAAASGTAAASAAAPSGAPSGMPSGMPSGGPGGGPGGMGGGGGSTETTAAKALAAQVGDEFTQRTYTDSSTGKKLPFNIFLPAGYSKNQQYPMVLYIADSSLVGGATTAPLNQYGALIWASDADQAKRRAIVVVPEYPSVAIDDNSGYTVSPYVELTARFVKWIQTQYAVDPARVYGTGQSMGCMTVMYLTAQHPTLFAAEYFVSGQWRPGQLAGLTKAKFVYFAAGGDSKASTGQADVKQILTSGKVAFQTAQWAATSSTATLGAAAKALLDKPARDYFVSFTTGTVLKANTSANSEHMASFEPAYKISEARDWLFTQHA